MLCDVDMAEDYIAGLISEMRGYEPKVTRLQAGVYEIHHFNFGDTLRASVKDYAYGVCDSYEQVIEYYNLIKSSHQFVMSVTEVDRDKQPDEGGWRWHKWGDYIGTQKPTCEYLYDEPEIYKVYCYHIYELV